MATSKTKNRTARPVARKAARQTAAPSAGKGRRSPTVVLAGKSSAKKSRSTSSVGPKTGGRRAKKKVTQVDCGWPEDLPNSKIRCPKCRAVLYDYENLVETPKCKHFLFCWDDTGPMLYCHDSLPSWETRIAIASGEPSDEDGPDFEELDEQEQIDYWCGDDRPMPDVEALAKLLDVNIVVFKVDGAMGWTYVAAADRPLP